MHMIIAILDKKSTSRPRRKKVDATIIIIINVDALEASRT